MGSLINSEIRYYWWIYAGAFVLAALLALLETHPVIQDLPVRFWLLIVVFLMIQNWIATRNKERRERHHALLPIGYQQQALTRLMLIFVPAMLLSAWFTLCLKMLDRMSPVYLSFQLKGLAVIFTGFLLYYVIRDLLMSYFRNLGISKNSIVISLTFVLVGLNILGIILFFNFYAGNTQSIPILDNVMYYIVSSTPFAGTAGIVKFFALCALLAGLNLASFYRRKTFLE